MKKRNLLIMRGSSQYVNPLFYNVQEIGLGKALGELGWNVTVISSGPNKQTIQVSDKLTWHELPRTGGGIGWPQGALKYLFSVNADLIQNQDISNTGIFLAYAASRKRKLPFIMSLGEYKPKNKSKSIYANLTSRVVSSKVEGVLCKTKEAMQYAQTLNLGPSFYAPIGIDPTSYDEHANSEVTPYMDKIIKAKHQGELVISHIGRLDKEDNLKFLFEVAHYCKRPVQLFIAGGPSDYAQSLSIRIPENITFLGKIKNSQIGHLLSLSDLYLSCSRYEIFGMSAAESIYHGCPVLGYSTGGIAEIVQSGMTGYLFELRDPKIWANFIDQITTYQLEKYKMNCCQYSSELTWSSRAASYHQAYEQILQRGEVR